MKTKNKSAGGTTIINTICAIIFFCIGVSGSFITMTKGFVGEFSFVTLIVLSSFISVLIWLNNRISLLKFLQFELKLREVQRSEKAIKELALAMIEYVETATEHVIADDDHDQKKVELCIEKIKRITS